MLHSGDDDDVFGAVRAFGTTVVHVPGLARDAVYVEDVDVALVRAELGEISRRRVAAWLWARALDRRTALKP